VPELQLAGDAGRGALLLRPWRASDMPALLTEMQREYPKGGLHSDGRAPDGRRWTGPQDEGEAAYWLAGQDRGWREGDWLTFAVLEADADGKYQLAGHVGLWNREDGGQVGHKPTAEIGYWTATGFRGRGVAPAAVLAVTAWAIDSFRPCGMQEIMLVHDIDNPASCRVARKAGYPFSYISPASPPLWYTDGHVHLLQCR
jgi:RimJ/RimL family protein N-acetyltransferase